MEQNTKVCMMNIEFSDDKISFTRAMKAPIFYSERWRDRTIKTWFRCSKEAEAALMKRSTTPVWTVLCNEEFVVVTTAQAKSLGYTDNDETLVAIDTKDGGFKWIPIILLDNIKEH